MRKRKTDKRIRRILEEYDMSSGIERQSLTAKAIKFKNGLYNDEAYKVLAFIDNKFGNIIDKELN